MRAHSETRPHQHKGPQKSATNFTSQLPGKTLEKILAARLSQIGRLTGGISPNNMGCLPNRSAIDGLMMDLTGQQAQLRQVSSYKNPATRPSLMANDIEGAFNCVSHSQLVSILIHYRFPKNLMKCIVAFNTNREIYMSFDSETESLVRFLAGLPQGSPLSPILFVIYSSVLDHRADLKTTSYVDDEIANVGASSQKLAAKLLQKHLNTRVKCGEL